MEISACTAPCCRLPKCCMASQPASVLALKLQCVQVTLQVLCVAPFLRVPTVQLGYNAQGQVLSQSLSLPLSVGKFCTPPGAPVPRDVFFSPVARHRRCEAVPAPHQMLRQSCKGVIKSGAGDSHVAFASAASNALQLHACLQARPRSWESACQG